MGIIWCGVDVTDFDEFWDSLDRIVLMNAKAAESPAAGFILFLAVFAV